MRVSNEQLAQGDADPQGTLAALSQLGRLDGYQVSYAAFPGQRAAANSSAVSVCYVEMYSTTDGATEALRGQRVFPAGVSVQEISAPQFGNGSRTFTGTVTDQRTGRQSPTTIIFWQRNRFVGTVTINGPAPATALPGALQLVTQMDGRALRYP
jgi:hypothetical protein